MKAEIEARTGVSMENSGYTLFGLDDPNGGPAISQIMRQAFNEVGGYDQFADIKHWGDLADGKRAIPKSVGDKVRAGAAKHMAQEVEKTVGPMRERFSMLTAGERIAFVYSHYTGTLLPQRLADVCRERGALVDYVRANGLDMTVNEQIIAVVATFWNVRWVNRLLHMGWIDKEVVTRHPFVISWLAFNYVRSRMPDKSTWRDVKELLTSMYGDGWDRDYANLTDEELHTIAEFANDWPSPTRIDEYLQRGRSTCLGISAFKAYIPYQLSEQDHVKKSLVKYFQAIQNTIIL